MIEHEVNSSNNFIMGWYSEDTTFCDQLIDIHLKNECNSNYVGVYGNGLVDKNIKDSIDSPVPPETLHWLKYGQVLHQCTELYTKKYPESFCSGFTVGEGFTIQKYPAGGGYRKWHKERDSADMMNVTRHLVFMTYLNDIADEGGTEFLFQKVKIYPKKGLTLMWPADWTFTHRGVISETEEKWIATGWFNLLKEVK